MTSLYTSVSDRVWSEYQALAKKGRLEYVNPLNMKEIWKRTGLYQPFNCGRNKKKCPVDIPGLQTNRMFIWRKYTRNISKKYLNKIIKHILQKMYNEYELHGMTDEKIRTAHFTQVTSLYILSQKWNDHIEQETDWQILTN